MEKTSLLARIDEIIDSRSEEIAEMSDFFAANPEVSGTEFKTSAKIVDVLTKAGFDVTYPYMNIPTAFIASCKGEKEGAKAAILVEYDALPEIGHACGHNLHGSMSVLAGLALLPVMKETGGELIVVGTPAEESDGAKVAMSEQGVFDGCDFAVMLHCTCGKSIVRYRSLAMDAIEFTFKGRTAHAASAPWEGRNALNGLQLFFHAIDMLRQHVRPDARMHGIYSEAGTAPNIVPEKAVGRFYFRASKRAYLDKMLEQVYNCAKGAALATATEVTWRNFEASFKDVLPNNTAETMMENLFAEFGMEVVPCPGFMGSSDVGDVSYVCPAVQPEIDIAGGEEHEPHTRAFAEATVTDTAHKAMNKGAKIIARSVLNVLLDEKLRASMWKDYKKETELAAKQ